MSCDQAQLRLSLHPELLRLAAPLLSRAQSHFRPPALIGYSCLARGYLSSRNMATLRGRLRGTSLRILPKEAFQGLASLYCGSISWLRITSRRLSFDHDSFASSPFLAGDHNMRSGTAGEILPRRCHTKLPIYWGVSK